MFIFQFYETWIMIGFAVIAVASALGLWAMKDEQEGEGK